MPPDRRPIPGRTLTVSHRTTALLVRCGASANAISITGLGFGILAGAAFASVQLFAIESFYARSLLIAAALCIFLRLLCNMFDGMVAIEAGKQSRVGAIYNELPDRISDAATLIGAGYAAAHGGGEPALGFVAALLAILTAYIRAMGKAEGAGNDFCGPMAKPHRMWTLIIACIVSAIVPGPWVANAGFMPPGVQLSALSIALAIIIVGSAITCIRRTLRIAHRLREMP